MALIENLVVALGLQSAGFSAGLKKAEQDLSGFGKVSSLISSGMSNFIGGMLKMAAGFLAVKYVISSLSTAMERLFNQAMSAQKLGASIEDFTGLAYAVGSMGIETEKFDTAMQKMLVTISNAAEGGEKEIGIFNRLGIATKKIANATLLEDVLLLASGFDKIQNAAERMDLARGIFGRGGAAMLNLLKDGKAGIIELIERAKFLGVLISSQDMSKILNLRNAWYDLGQSVKGVWNDILIANAEPITVLFRSLADFIANARIQTELFWKEMVDGAWDAVTVWGILYSIIMEIVDGFKLMMYGTAAWMSTLTAFSAWMQGLSKGDQDFFTLLAKEYDKKMEAASAAMISGATGGYIDRLRAGIAKLKAIRLEGKEGDFIGGGSENLSPAAVMRGTKEAAEAIFKAGGQDTNYAQQTVIKLADLNKAADAIDARLMAISGALGLDAGIV